MPRIPTRNPPQTVLDQMYRRMHEEDQQSLDQFLANRFGAMIQGGMLNAGLLFGGIPAANVNAVSLRVKNTSGGAMVKGDVVVATGSSSGVVTVSKARANADGTMPGLAILTVALANNAEGVALRLGTLTGIDTSAWSVGDELYVSSATAGALTSVSPSARAQAVATVTVDHATLGELQVNFGHDFSQPLDAHIADATAAHAASAISSTPAGSLSSTDVQAALNELDTDAVADAAALAAHLSDTSDAHDASAISTVPAGTLSATDVQAALDELASEKITLAEAQAIFQSFQWKQPVRVATTAAGTLATSFENGDTQDTIVLATGDRILIKDQAAPAENGIYTVNASGAPTRAADFDLAAEIPGAAVLVREGATNADTGWVCTNDAPPTIGSTSIVFTQFPGMGALIAGLGLTRTGNTLDVGAGTGIVVNANDVELGSHDHDAATAGHGGILTNDAHDGFSEYAETSAPSTPAADKIRVHPLDVGGRSVFQYILDTGQAVQIGHALYAVVRNTSGSTIAQGKAIRLTGQSSGIMTVSPARANAFTTLWTLIGVTAESIANNANGLAILKGKSAATNYDTSAGAGSPVWLSVATAGDIQNNSPAVSASSFPIVVGYSLNSSAGAGEIYVDPARWMENHTHGATGAVPGSGTGGAILLPDRIGSGNPILTTLAAGTTHNWNPGSGLATSGLIIRITGSGAWILGGIVAPTVNKDIWLHIHNDSGFTGQINHQDAGSSAGNRVSTYATDNITIPHRGALTLFYNSTLNEWRTEVVGFKRHIHSNDDGGGQLDNSSIATGAEIEVAKLQDGAALQVVRTDTAGSGVEWGPAPLVKLAETIVTGSAVASIDFSGIPATYRGLLVMVNVKADAGSPALAITVNNDSGANYDYQRVLGSAAVVTAAEGLGQTSFLFLGLGATAGRGSTGVYFFPNYASTVLQKTFVAVQLRIFASASADLSGQFGGGDWKSTAAINRLTFTPSAGNLDIGSSISIWGAPQ